MQLPLFSNGQPIAVFVVTRRMSKQSHPYIQEFFDNNESAEKFVEDWANYASSQDFYETIEYSANRLELRNGINGTPYTMIFEVWEITLADALNILFNPNEHAKGAMLKRLVDKRDLATA